MLEHAVLKSANSKGKFPSARDHHSQQPEINPFPHAVSVEQAGFRETPLYRKISPRKETFFCGSSVMEMDVNSK